MTAVMTVQDTIDELDQVTCREEYDAVKEQMHGGLFYDQQVCLAMRRAKLRMDERPAPHLYHGPNIVQARMALSLNDKRAAADWIRWDMGQEDDRFWYVDANTLNSIPAGAIEFSLEGEPCA